MTIQVFIQSGAGGALLTIITFPGQRFTLTNALGVASTEYITIIGNTTTPPVGNSSIRNSVQSWEETFTVTGSGTSRDLISPQRHWGLQVKATNPQVGMTWDVRLEISLNNVDWTDIGTHTDIAPGDGKIQPLIDKAPAYYARTRVTGLVLSGSTNIITHISGMP